MIEYFAVGVFSLFASLISFFSGFGLGTTLMPMIAIFFPLPIAIALTAVVHLLHNFLKTGLLLRAIRWKVVCKFGLLAMAFSIPGAFLLKKLSEFAPIFIFGNWWHTSILHICIGSLLILFASLEAFPLKLYKMKNLFLGGIISGFFGGLSGNQGALRSIFLIHANLDKSAFIGTSAFIAMSVDLIRLIVYSLSFTYPIQYITFLIVSMGATATGVFLGIILLKKVTMGFMKKSIVTLLYLFGVSLILGII